MALSGIYRNPILVSLQLLALVAYSRAETPVTAPPPKKVVILYSDTGAGHISAAEGLKEAILRRDPGAKVILKNVWDFTPGWMSKVKKAAWSVTLKKFPAFRDWAYARSMEAGNAVTDLRDFNVYHRVFNQEQVYEFLRNEAPESVIATNYSGAEILRSFRQDGLLSNTNLGWVFTDYAEGYWPRVSQHLDRTFLPHDALVSSWVSRGVSRDKLAVTGMPLGRKLFAGVNSKAIREAHGLAEKVPLLVLTGGSDGAAPFSEIVKGLAERIPGPLQIVAVAGRNEGELAKLEALSRDLDPRITLKARALVPHDELLDLVKASDLYVAKAGGLSPTEGFAIGKPMVIYRAPGGGVETGNIAFFRNQGLASVADKPSQVPELAAGLLRSKDLQSDMLSAQKRFRSGLNLNPMVDFSLRPRPVPALQTGVFSLLEEPPPGTNRAMLLDTEGRAFQTRVELVKSAKKNINYSMFIQRTDEVGLSQFRTLRDAARRGVRVRLVLDDQGARKVPLGLMRHLTDEGVEIRIYHKRTLRDLKRLHRRMHDKFISADGQRLIVGDKNSQNSYYNVKADKNRMNYDGLEIYLEGQDVATENKYYETLWASDETSPVEGLSGISPSEAMKGERMLAPYDDEKLAALIHQGYEPGLMDRLVEVKSARVVHDPLGVMDNSSGTTQQLFEMIRSAKSEVVVVSPYFIPTREFERELVRASARGIPVTIYTNSLKSNDNPIVAAAYRTGLPRFDAAGIEVREYNRTRNLHTKLIFVDGGKKTYIGSYNVDPRSQRLNTEVGIILEDDHFGSRFSKYISELRPKTYRVTKKRNLFRSFVPKETCVQDTVFELIAAPETVRDFL